MLHDTKNAKRIKYIRTLATGEEPSGDGLKNPEQKQGDGAGKSFTQDDVNRLLAESKREHQAKFQSLSSELQKIQSTVKLTAEEKEQLAIQVETLKKTFMTEAELKEQAARRKETELKEQSLAQANEAKAWKERYSRSTIHSALADAAAKNDAYNTQQLVTLLRENTSLEEAISDDGKPTGEFNVKVNKTIVKDGKNVSLTLTPDDAIKALKEDPSYANLFKGTGTGGHGGGKGSQDKLDPERLAAENPTLYRKLRAEGKIKL